MRRYEVWQLKPQPALNAQDLSFVDYVMILQSEKLDHLYSIIVAPLKPQRGDLMVPSLTPTLDINSTPFTILVPLMSAIDKRDLGTLVASGDTVSYEVTKALDRLFTGI
jgi:CcdB protein